MQPPRRTSRSRTKRSSQWRSSNTGSGANASPWMQWTKSPVVTVLVLWRQSKKPWTTKRSCGQNPTWTEWVNGCNTRCLEAPGRPPDNPRHLEQEQMRIYSQMTTIYTNFSCYTRDKKAEQGAHIELMVGCPDLKPLFPEVAVEVDGSPFACRCQAMCRIEVEAV